MLRIGWRPPRRFPALAGVACALLAVGVLFVVPLLTPSGAQVLLTGLGGTATATPSSGPTPSPSSLRTFSPRLVPTTAQPRTTRPNTPAPPPQPPPPGVDQWVLAGGGSGVVGTGGRGLRTYTVEVEVAAGLNADAVAAVVEETLGASRGWTNEGWTFQRIADPNAAAMRVRVATPGTVDRYCAPVRTNGSVSCRNGKWVMINLNRWNTGSPPDYGVGDVAEYRHLVLNHEIGHFLGHGHPGGTGCAGDGLAMVMKSVYGIGVWPCTRNVWPYREDGTYIG